MTVRYIVGEKLITVRDRYIISSNHVEYISYGKGEFE